jgi:AraC family transcriptional regulator
MDAWIARIERALELLAGRLDAPPTLAEVAAAARVSPFHFHRIWRAMTGETLHATTERLRIAMAQQRLAEEGASVTQVAMTGGYGTSQSFARAFRRATGLSPTQFLAGGSRASLSAKPDVPLRIELRPDCTLVALRQEGGAYRELNALFWQLWTWAETAGRLEDLTGIYGIPLDDPESVGVEALRYDACLAIPDPGAPPPPFRTITLPAGSYAVTRHLGSYDGLEAANQRLVHQLLASGREPADLPLFHHFLDDPEAVAEADLRTDILLLLLEDGR